MGKRKRERLQLVADTRATTAQVFGREMSLSGTVFVPSTTAYSGSLLQAVGVPAVFRCVQLIADAIAPRPWTEWTGDPETDATARMVRPSRLTRRPAASMTRRTWTWRVVSSLVLWRIAYLWPVGGWDDDGMPGSLLPIPPSALTPVGPMDPAGILPPMRYQLVGRGELSREQLQVLELSPFVGLAEWQVSLLRLAQQTLAQAVAADEYARSWWVEGGAPSVQITTDQELTDAQAAAIAARWTERHGSSTRTPAVLGKGAMAKPFGADASSESAQAARAELIADVALWLGVDPILLNAPTRYGSLTYSTSEGVRLSWLQTTVRPIAELVAEAVSEWLPGDYLEGRRARIELGEHTMGTQAERAAAWSALIAAGVVEPDEVRPREGFGPRPEASRAAAADASAAAAAPVESGPQRAMEGVTA